MEKLMQHEMETGFITGPGCHCHVGKLPKLHIFPNNPYISIVATRKAKWQVLSRTL